MKPLLLSALLCASAQAQVIQLIPTNYCLSISSQNNMGRFWSSWQNSTRDTITLGARTLTFSHAVYFNETYFNGSRIGGPMLLEDRYVYRQIGGATYIPVGGEEITFFAPKVAGGWIARTNSVAASDMHTIFWLPELVGEVTTGNRWWRTVTTASALELTGRNLSGMPQLLRIRCVGAGDTVEFLLRFESGQRKPFMLGTTQAGLPWFTFDMDDTREDAL